METMYTVREVVQKGLLGYKERTVRQLIRDGVLRSKTILREGGKQRRVLIPESAITEFLASQAVPTI